MAPPGPLDGLEIQNINPRWGHEDGATALIIEGQIFNLSGAKKAPPKIRVLLRDADQGELAQWSFDPDYGNMIPGEYIDFKTSIRAPPDGVVAALMHFEPPTASAQDAGE